MTHYPAARAFPPSFQNVQIRTWKIGTRTYYCARDLGRALAYDSDGGNLARLYNHGSEWREAFVEGEDYVRDTRGRILLTAHGVLQTLRLVVAIERPDRAELADALLRQWASRAREMRAA